VRVTPPRTREGARYGERARINTSESADEVAAIRIDIAAGSVYLAMMSSRDPIDKRSPARRFRDPDCSARAQANAGSEPRDPFWWSAVLATRAAFAARPGAKLISVHSMVARSVSPPMAGGV
jgi:hypothetical protein